MEEIRYPIGKFQFTEPTKELRKKCIEQFMSASGLLREAVARLDKNQLLS